MKNLFHRIKNWYQNLPDKKKYIELISATLTVPMLFTVIIVNLNNIKGQKNNLSTTNSSTTTPIQIVITGNPDQKDNQTILPSPSTIPTSTGIITPTTTPTVVTPTPNSCIQEIGPIEILSPQEGEIITSEKVCLTISTDSKYCPLVWSYKLDDGNWSEFSSNNICLYNLDNGSKQLQIKFKNTSNDNTITLARNFTYQNPNKVTLSPTATIADSPTPTP